MSLAAVAGSPAVRAALGSGSIGGLLTSPLVRTTIRYWWLAAPIGWFAVEAWREHKKKGDLSVRTMVHEMAPAITLAATLVLLNDCLGRASAPAARAPAAAKDASFTVQPTTPAAPAPAVLDEA